MPLNLLGGNSFDALEDERGASQKRGSCSSSTVRKLLVWGKKELENLGPVEDRLSAEWLLGKVLGLSRSQVYLQPGRFVLTEQAESYRHFVSLRAKRFPCAYIVGESSFWDEVLEVDPRCLIPRPETEILVERFIQHAGQRVKDTFSFLDLGCGSGAIAIALLRHFPHASGTLSDRSKAALEVTRRNLIRYDLQDRGVLVCADLFSAFGGQGKRQWDAILSNPPYLSSPDLEKGQPEILFEPREALYGGEDGCDFYRRIAGEAKGHLAPGGLLVLETGIKQSAIVLELLRENGYRDIRVFKDDQAIERVILARKAT